MPTCDYCDEGNVAIDGWHSYPEMADEGYDGLELERYRVPCAVNPSETPLEVGVL